MTVAPVEPDQLAELVAEALDAGKGHDIKVLDVRPLTAITDYMIVVTGRSSRQVRALADQALEAARAAGIKPIGVEGQQMSEWVLIDFGDVVVHAMQPEIRSFYQLEKLWETPVRAAPETAAN